MAGNGLGANTGVGDSVNGNVNGNMNVNVNVNADGHSAEVNDGEDGSLSGFNSGSGSGSTMEGEKGFESANLPKDRRKIEIKFIENKTRRHVTFSKRKHGIMKKAFELSVLTGTQVLLLIVSETGLVYTFSTPKFEPIVTQQEGRNLIQACLNAPDEDEEEEEEEEQDAEDGNNLNEDEKVQVRDDGGVVGHQEDIPIHLRHQASNQQMMDQQQQIMQQHQSQQQQQHRPELPVHLPPGQQIQYPNMGNMQSDMNNHYMKRQDQPESTYQQYFQDSTHEGV